MHEYSWAIGVGIIILAVSVGKAFRALSLALASRVPRAAPLGDPAGTELRAEVDDMRQRLAELEERVDFTERLLAKHRNGERLAPP
jgi:hypothetical protein